MNTLKKMTRTTLLLLAVGLAFTACKKDEDEPTTPEPTPSSPTSFNISSNITENTTWTTGNTYILSNRVSVESGNTLTIEPGVIIKGEAGTGANATALIIARGAKIDAQGSPTSPIIFTSIADEIVPGEIDSPNLDENLDGLWGGLIILGNAPISADAATIQIEGIPPSDQNGLYGGSNPSDNSGIVRYISIRHGGANIGEGNEINGLTLGGVGTGTILEYIEVIANQDDGVEWFGGTVDVSNVIVWNVGDDAIDVDQAWSGTLDNFIVISGSDTDHGLEIDGPEGSLLDGQTVKNGSIKGHNNSELADFRDGARGTYQNLYFFGYTNPAENGGAGDFSISGVESASNLTAGHLAFENLEITLPAATSLDDVFKGGTATYATSVSSGANTVGANKSAFTGWTMCDARNQLDSF